MKAFDFFTAVGEERIESLRRKSWPKGWAIFPYFAPPDAVQYATFVDFYLCFDRKDGTKYTLTLEDRMADDWEGTEKEKK